MNKREKLFWKKVDKGNKDKCWEWTACCNKKGYGRFRNGTKAIYAHRYAWEITNGPIPDGMCVLHHCDNPKCVNPNHLFLGTQADNMQDKVQKDRQAPSKGEDNGRSKLIEEQVLEIRHRYATEENILQKELAKEYSVSPQEINRIVNRKTWKHI